MKVFEINGVAYGSTGRIMFALADSLEAEGNQVLCTSGFTWKTVKRPDFFLTSNIVEKTIHTYLARITGLNGCFSIIATWRLLRKLDRFHPDVMHLHNLHGWFLNLPMFCRYIRKHDIPVIWTLHDCWPLTGQCPHFEMAGCEKWKRQCSHCTAYRQYPRTFTDHSAQMHRRKKRWFSGFRRLTFVTPSQWLADRVRESYLSTYPVEVISNGVDPSIFCPRESDIRQRYHITAPYLVLGVAYAWDDKKGLDVFQSLANSLGGDYQIVLVGTDSRVDHLLPPSIISVHRTQNSVELAEFYTTADVFVNPTREDTFPTVNLEALGCGTPVVTFCTGGSPESLDDSCGSVVSKNDILALEREIRRICIEKPYLSSDCLERAKQFTNEVAIQKYMSLFRAYDDKTTTNAVPVADRI